MKRLHTHQVFLKAMKEGNDNQRAQLLYYSSPSQQKCIAEILHNMLRGSVPMHPDDVEALRPHRKRIEKYSNPNILQSTRHSMTRYQRGGWLGGILKRVFHSSARKATAVGKKVARQAIAAAKKKGLRKAVKKTSAKALNKGKEILKSTIDDLTTDTSKAIKGELSKAVPTTSVAASSHQQRLQQLYERLTTNTKRILHLQHHGASS